MCHWNFDKTIIQIAYQVKQYKDSYYQATLWDDHVTNSSCLYNPWKKWLNIFLFFKCSKTVIFKVSKYSYFETWYYSYQVLLHIAISSSTLKSRVPKIWNFTTYFGEKKKGMFG